MYLVTLSNRVSILPILFVLEGESILVTKLPRRLKLFYPGITGFISDYGGWKEVRVVRSEKGYNVLFNIDIIPQLIVMLSVPLILTLGVFGGDDIFKICRVFSILFIMLSFVSIVINIAAFSFMKSWVVKNLKEL